MCLIEKFEFKNSGLHYIAVSLQAFHVAYVVQCTQLDTMSLVPHLLLLT